MKPILFVGSSQKDLQDFPEDVKDDIGYALYQVQMGGTPVCAKPLKGLGPRVLEIIEDFRGDAYRAVYTVKFEDIVYVLHCFQKKSKQGNKTPLKHMELIESRLKRVEDDHKARIGE